jgi:hypothetical protein
MQRRGFDSRRHVHNSTYNALCCCCELSSARKEEGVQCALAVVPCRAPYVEARHRIYEVGVAVTRLFSTSSRLPQQDIHVSFHIHIYLPRTYHTYQHQHHFRSADRHELRSSRVPCLSRALRRGPGAHAPVLARPITEATHSPPSSVTDIYAHGQQRTRCARTVSRAHCAPLHAPISQHPLCIAAACPLRYHNTRCMLCCCS